MKVLSDFLILFWAVPFGVTVWATWYALKEIRQENLEPETYPPISILKPLKGVDSGLATNLESFFHLDYPNYELLFSVSVDDDPAARVVRDLIRMYPEKDARLFVGGSTKGINPKVNNMVRSYEAAKFDNILISDSNVRVRHDYLRRLAGHLSDGFGIVTSVVAGDHCESFGGQLEATFLNTFYARGMYACAACGFPAVVGKAMYFKKSTAERFGGLPILSGYIAEDYMAGQAMQHLGLKVAISREPVLQYIGDYPFKSFWDRHVRWGRIRKSHAPFAFLIEPLFGAFLSGVLGAFLVSPHLGVRPLSFFALHLLAWFTCDLALVKGLKTLRRSFPASWLARELLAFPLWTYTLLGNTVQWRSGQYRLLPGGILEN